MNIEEYKTLIEKTKINRYTEHNLQCDIINYLRKNKVFVFAIPNGGVRDKKTGSELKKEGALSGVSDLLIIGRARVYFIELKKQKGAQSETQKYFNKCIKELNQVYCIWRSVEDAVKFYNENKKDIRKDDIDYTLFEKN